MSHTAPSAILTILGTLVAVLGLFAAGDIVVVTMGLGAVLAAAVLGVDA